YAVLGVSPGASAAEVVRAYRRRLRRVHPDTRPEDLDHPATAGGHAEPGGTGEALALLREAFAVLGDPVRRAAYDRHTRPAPGPSRPSTSSSPTREPYLAGRPDPPLRAGPVRYRPSPPTGR
ncbi:MAG: DnaJ domain-containing protein, partial [Acidothermales bacterium]|nr:DnaJ domain-containing protein [Acidothermales bacterium]